MDAVRNNDRLNRIISLLCCPSCHRKMSPDGAVLLRCSNCGVSARMSSCINFLSDFSPRMQQEPEQDLLYRAKKSVIGRSPQLYASLVRTIAPVYGRINALSELGSPNPARSIIVELGSGSLRTHPDIINIDLFPYDEVDIRCSIESLPLPSDSVDGVICIAVLEHVIDPARVVQEIFRMLKPGGRLVCFIPFMQGIHAAPDDYQRYAPSGLQHLFRAFSAFEYRTCGGPSSSLLWVLQEWLAMCLSFGSRRLYWIFYFLLFILFPLKYLDILLTRHPMSEKIASGFLVTASKPLASTAE